MTKEPDKREDSIKPELDDTTDYQVLNSLGRAAVLGAAQETPAPDATGDAVTGTIDEDQFKQICQEAMDDPRSMDPNTLLFEILVRVRERAGHAEPRGAVPLDVDITPGESCWREIAETLRNDFKAEFDVDEIIGETTRENSERKER
jgi:hypothetical protein